LQGGRIDVLASPSLRAWRVEEVENEMDEERIEEEEEEEVARGRRRVRVSEREGILIMLYQYQLFKKSDMVFTRFLWVMSSREIYISLVGRERGNVSMSESTTSTSTTIFIR
jgi:hypothetical protein